MNPESSWIATFVQQTLSEYLGQASRSNITVEDDGASLSFDSHGHVFTAHVQEWGIGPSGHGAVLQDTDHQIDAVIPKEILSSTQSNVPHPKHYSTNLLDFKLVFTYTTTPAQVHLLVTKFHINLEHGKSKNFQLKRKLTKNPKIKSLLESTRRSLQGTSKAAKPDKSTSHAVRCAEATQTEFENGALAGNESQKISSQVPHSHSVREQASQAHLIHLHETNHLLRHLRSSSPSVMNKTTSLVQHEKMPDGQKGMNVVPRNGINVIYATQQFTTETASKTSDQNAADGSSSDEGGSISSQTRNGATGQDSVTHHGPQSPSRKRPREEANVLSQPASHKDKNVDLERGDPPKKRHRTGSIPEISARVSKIGKAAQETATTSSSEAQNPVTVVPQPVSSRKDVAAQSDPWEGFNGIKKRDVTVPKDQEELLSDNRLCWIPNDPSPQGHIPPSLLKAWNNAVTKRHRETETRTATATPERPVSLTQESDVCSNASSPDGRFSWSPTPERSPPTRRHYLPPSSPVAQPTPRGKKLKPKPTENNPSNQPVDIDSLMDDVTPRKTPLSESGNNKGLHEVSRNPASEASQTLDSVTSQDQSRRLYQSSQNSSPRHEIEMSNQPSQQLSGIPAPNQESGRESPVHSIPLRSSPEAQKDQSDEESVMDTSVPFALGESIPDPTQSSQVEEELTSSGPSLPAVNGECIQVAVSPLVGNGQLHRDTSDNILSERGHSNASQPSSQSHKTSSQSRVLNTYPHANHEEFQSSHETSTPDEQSQDIPIQVNIPVTQPQASSMPSQSQPPSQSQDVTNNSQPDIVLDSSGPARRHQDMSLAAIQPSSLEITSSHESTQSQPNQPKQESASGPRYHHNPMSSLIIFPNQQAETSENTRNRYLSRDSNSSPRERETTHDKHLNTQSAHLLARRQGFISNAKTQAQAREVYQQFCSCYASYSGDFGHFTKLCQKLFAMRQQGKLQRSFLWDDFIIMHLQSYPSYMENALSQDSKTLSYEDYFLETFSRPSFKKRCLTARGIGLVASQSNTDERPPITGVSSNPTSTPAQAPVSDVSFTGSLVGRFTDLCARSFNAFSQGSPSTPAIGHGRSSRESSVEIKLEGDELTPLEPMDAQVSPVKTRNAQPIVSTGEPEKDQTALANTQDTPVLLEAEGNNMDVEMDVKLEVEVDVDMDEIPETDQEDTLHETASVELGDESFESSTRAQSPAEDKPTEAMPNETMPSEVIAAVAEDSEPESENENWFLSLRHMRPKRDVWCDGPTEFKRWAEADQNVFSERLRRGGAKILLDEFGVIRRPNLR